MKMLNNFLNNTKISGSLFTIKKFGEQIVTGDVLNGRHVLKSEIYIGLVQSLGLWEGIVSSSKIPRLEKCVEPKPCVAHTSPLV